MIHKKSRIVIVGAGPAGLSTAYWLKRRGYTSVTVLEKLRRVGGLCKSITVDGASFDVGANFVTAAYTNVRAFAEQYGAEMYSERPFYVMVAPLDPTQPVTYQSLFDYVRERKDGSITPAPVFMLASMKYAWLRWRLSSVIDQPTFAGVASRPELCGSFADWLRAQPFAGKDLEHYLHRLFQVPVTMMGYGFLEDTAAPYVLKFMTLETFIPMCMKSIPVVGEYLTPWPKRFTLGFQRLWERMSWDLDVRTGVSIERIDREDDGPVRISFTKLDTDMNQPVPEKGELECDAVILACPLAAKYLDARDGGMLALTDEERALFGKISSMNYYMTTHTISDFGSGLDQALGATSPLLCVFPEDAATTGRPWAAAQANKDVDFVQFYTMAEADAATPFEEVRRRVETGCKELIRRMGLGNPAPPTPAPASKAWETFDRWNYFQHVEPEDFAAGWYDELARMQGRRRTYYVGGATNFELIEPITEFAKSLVETHFPG